MKNDSFVNEIIELGEKAKQKAVAEFSTLSKEQFNWKPAVNSWSVAECLDHLIISNSLYFQVFKKIANGHYTMSLKERYSPLTFLWGMVMKDAMKEQVTRKMKTHKTLSPVKSNFDETQLVVYTKNCLELLNHISNCREANLDKTVVTSPVLSFVTYNLRDTFTFLITHQHRHINQGIRVKSAMPSVQ
jgi:uncharacterized damage-inducible protein DinB